MRKLELELDSLTVESFATGATEPSLEARGTINANEVSAKATSCCPQETYVFACPVSTGCP